MNGQVVNRMANAMIVWLVLSAFALLTIFPLGSLVAFTRGAGYRAFWEIISGDGARAAFSLTFRVALCTAIINAVVGTAVAFVLCRGSFPGKRIVDALVDVPLSVPTVVVGFALLVLYGPSGLIGGWLSARGISLMFSFPGIVLAHVFVTFPFTVRAVGSVLQNLDPNYEKAARTLGASPVQAFLGVSLPLVQKGILAGAVLTFARSVGEFGATIMVSGNLLGRTQTGPLYIYSRFNNGDIQGASAVAATLAALAFIMLIVVKLALEPSKDGAQDV